MKKLILTYIAVCSVSLTAQVPDKLLLKVFDAAYRSNPRKNIMLSPWGIQQCFGMLTGWTTKAGSDHLDTVLGLNIQTRQDLRNARLALQKTQAEFNSFNAVLVDRRYTLKQPFIQDANYFFGSKLYRLDLGRKEECATALNSIIKRESRNMFDNVFTPQDFYGDPAMILLNTLYFKANWLNSFKEYQTKKERFMTPSASNFEAIHHSHVDMMNDEKYVPYYNDGTIHGIILDYADECFKMLVLTTVKMPSSLKTVTGNLARKGLQHFIRNSSARNKTVIKLPKLKLGSQLDLKSLLSSIGLKSFFDPQKGCLCIIQNSPSLYISQARQVVKLSLDETGTEVAAVTTAIFKAAYPPQQKVKYNKFYADHPFVLVLFDSQTQAILLTAAIVHPEEK